MIQVKERLLKANYNYKYEQAWLTTFPHEECIDSKARSSTYKSTALSSGRVDVKLKPKSITTWENKMVSVLQICIST